MAIGPPGTIAVVLLALSAALLVGWLATGVMLRRERCRRQASEQRLEEARADLDRFVYVASHDLQEPVRAVHGFTKLLAARCQEQLDQEATRFVEYAAEGAARLSRMVLALLEYGRVDGRELTSASVPMASLFAETLAGMPEDTRVAQITEGQGLPQVVGDPYLIRRLVENLVEVASLASADLELRAESDGGQWLIGVDFLGWHVPPERSEEVFAPFFRVGDRNEPSMGLAICRRMVVRQAGRMWAEPLPAGLRICFTLPVDGQA